MAPERMFKDLLGLGLSWEVVCSRFDKAASKVILEIRETSVLWEHERCPKDGSEVSCYDHTELLVWRHLNVFEHQCEIHCRLPRAKCRKCGAVYRVRPPWEGLSMHFTKEFEAFALILMREMPMAKVSEVLGESDTRLWRMLEKQVEAARKEVDMSFTCCVAVDELNARKGQKYVTVFADLPARRVLYATEGRDHQTWSRFCEDLGKHNGHPHAITQVSMDMSGGYQKGVAENCRNAEIIFDKFHVLAHANSAVDKVRGVEMRFGAAKYLRSTKWLWRKNPENLREDERARLEKIPSSLHTSKAYQMRLVLQAIYRLETKSAAKWKLRAWCRWVKWMAKKHPWSLYRPMVKVANMIENHLKGILGYWDGGWTNAYMEGLNSIFQATKRRARGYRSTTKLITMVYLIAGKLRLPQF